MNGDPVTLSINPEEIKTEKKAEKFLWTFENKYIATIDLESKTSQAEYPDKRFTDRLNLDRNTGSLTINHIRTEDTGEYQMEIRNSGKPKYKTFSVTVNDEPSTFSVIKGDTVTLPTDVKIRPDDVQWKFNGNIFANLTHSTITNMDVNSTNAMLNINNISPDQSGEYEVRINGSGFIIHRTFRVRAVTDEVESLSVMKEETVTLNTKVKTQAGDVIEWKFKNTPIAKMDRRIDPQPDPALDGRFRDRLDVNSRGYLIITHIKTNESGFYDVNITNINRSIQKRFSLTVTESSSGSHQEKICPGLFVVVIMLVTALFMPVTGDD
ncbi:hemicentin-1-like isoform X2 [Paramisgurnus dabryanus]